MALLLSCLDRVRILRVGRRGTRMSVHVRRTGPRTCAGTIVADQPRRPGRPLARRAIRVPAGKARTVRLRLRRTPSTAIRIRAMGLDARPVLVPAPKRSRRS